MTDFMQKLNDIASSCQLEFSQATSEDAVETLRIKYLGRIGILKDLQKEFGALPIDLKKQFGPTFNTIKTTIETAWKDAKTRLQANVVDAPIDLTAPQMYRITLSTGAIVESPDQKNITPYLIADYANLAKKVKQLEKAYIEKCNELYETEKIVDALHNQCEALHERL